ncbi:hypothetical protein [Nocardioides daejeonensis]|uniref:hypothetical protein n=1 Tax=Nocardioides daejeonensis TaxID=1046556 RepID=UPI000D7412D5|nr:hypothetical protein [Nocardioides daejeonensis]
MSEATTAGAPSAGEGNGRVLIGLLVLLGLLVAGGVGVAAALDADEPRAPATTSLTPAQTVAEAIGSITEGDCEAARRHVPALDDTLCHALRPAGFRYGEVRALSADAEEAIVQITVHAAGDAFPVRVWLERDVERWVVVDWSEPAGTARQ